MTPLRHAVGRVQVLYIDEMCLMDTVYTLYIHTAHFTSSLMDVSAVQYRPSLK